MSRKSNEAYQNLDEARKQYIVADLLYTALCNDRELLHLQRGTTDAEREEWALDDNEPDEVLAINDACMSAIFIRSDARDALVDAAVEFTKALSPKIANDPDLPKLWEHIKTNPYSPTSKKALASILKVRI